MVEKQCYSVQADHQSFRVENKNLLESVINMGVTETEKGTRSITADVSNQFNYVYRVSLHLQPTDNRLLSFSCTCEAARTKKSPCKHCMAVLCKANDVGLLQLSDLKLAEPMQGPTRKQEQPILSEQKIYVFSETVPKPGTHVLPEAAPARAEEVEQSFPESTEQTPAAVEQQSSWPSRSESDCKKEEVPSKQSMEILLGSTMETGEPVYWYPNDTQMVFHPNMGIIGTMGTGKTQFTKSVVTQICRQGGNNYGGDRCGILIFDYKGDYNLDHKDFLSATNSRVIRPHKIPFNPLTLYRGAAYRELLPLHTANLFKETLTKIYHLGVKQQSVLLDCIMGAYHNRGIKEKDPSTWSRVAPTFDDVFHVYEKRPESESADSLSAAMNHLHMFQIFEEAAEKTWPFTRILKSVSVIDLTMVDEDIQRLVVSILLDQIYMMMQTLGSSQTDGRFRQLRFLTLIDEADDIISQNFASLRNIVKKGREYGVGVIFSTQFLSHFISKGTTAAKIADDYSRYILTWIVHNVDDLKKKEVEYLFKLPSNSRKTTELFSEIKQLEKHQSIIKIANGLPIQIQDKPFWQLCEEQSRCEPSDR